MSLIRWRRVLLTLAFALAFGPVVAAPDVEPVFHHAIVQLDGDGHGLLVAGTRNNCGHVELCEISDKWVNGELIPGRSEKLSAVATFNLGGKQGSKGVAHP